MEIKERINIQLKIYKDRGMLDKNVGIFLFEHSSRTVKNLVVQLEMWRTKLRITFYPDNEDYRILVEEIHYKDHHEEDSISGDFYIEEDELEKLFGQILTSYKILGKPNLNIRRITP